MAVWRCGEKCARFKGSSPCKCTEEGAPKTLCIPPLCQNLNEGKWKNIYADIFKAGLYCHGCNHPKRAANITSIYSCFFLSSLQNCCGRACCRGWRWWGVFPSSAALSLQTMRAAVGGSAGLWCLMIGKLVACNGAAMCLIMQNRRVRVGREWHFRAPGRLMRGQLFVCIPRHLLPETRSQLPPLMKFDIVEMTGAMTALSQDRVKEEEEGGGGLRGGGHICYHTCALLLHCSKVRAWWKRWWFPSRQAIHHSGGDSAEARSQRNNDTRRFE